MRMQKLSPVLFVPEIEPCLSFWTERLGFEIHAKVPDQGPLAFALLVKDDVNVMLQTRASLAEDLPQLAERDGQTRACLYIHVDDIDAVERALTGHPLVQERRTTFYGATEVAVREPAGSVIIFAERNRA